MFKVSKLFFLPLLLFIFSNSYSQDKIIDSLEIALQNPKMHDTTRLQSILLVMGQNYNEFLPNYYYLNRKMGTIALKNYKQKNSPELHKIYAQYLGTYYNTLMIEYGTKKDVPKALAYIDKSIAIFKAEKLHDDMYFAIVAKGTFLSKINEYEKAISYLFEALKYFEKNRKQNADGIAYVESSLAAIYSNQGNEEKAISYYKNVIAYYDTKKPLYAQDEFSQCVAYSNIGTSYLFLKKYPEALASFNKALALARKLGDDTTASIILTKMGRVKLAELKLDEAELLLKKALLGEINALATSNAYVKLGELYYKKNDLTKADFYLTKGLAMSHEIKDLELQEQASALLFEVSKGNKDFKKALEMHELQDKLADSSKAEASKNMLSQQQLKYDFEKKELNYKLATEKKNAQKNNVLIALSGFVLLLLLGGYFYYRNNKQKQAIMVLEKNHIKQKLMVSQMNPHFIYNSIDNIQGLIYNKQDDDAVNYLTKFSKLTRQILENSNENYISLAEEVEMIKNYAAIQQLLYGSKFDFKIEVENELDTESLFLPPMLTQPFIENAIKHGLGNKTENGMINIGFYLKENRLFFEVSDNGNGFDETKKQNSHKSLAMTITKERLVNYTKNKDFILQTENITDKDQNVIGAKVIFEIPYIYEN